MAGQAYPGVYRAKALAYSSGALTALVPQVFGDITIVVTDFSGDPPPDTEMGWIAFQSGDPEYPVWMSKATLPPDLAHDHPQYLTPGEADALFLTPAEGDSAYALSGHAHTPVVEVQNTSGTAQGRLAVGLATPTTPPEGTLWFATKT